MSLVLSIGTFVESFYGSLYAQKKIYHSLWALSIWGFLSLVLIAVMRDRFPWRKRHISFLTAHVGLLMIFLGSLVTQKYGVDGSLALELKDEKQKWIYLKDRELSVYASLDGQNLREIKKQSVDFIGKKTKLKWNIGSYELEVLDYIHHTRRDSKIRESTDQRALPALQFELRNENTHVVPWILLERKKGFKTIDLGPAKITFCSQNYDKKISLGKKPHLLLRPSNKNQIHYELYKGDLKKKGHLRKGSIITTGWMNLKLRLINYYPHAEEVVFYDPIKFESKSPLSAIKLSFDNKIHWLGLNSVLKIFTDSELFFIVYGIKKMPLKFDIKLEQFIIKNYPGSQKAASYESLVKVKELQKLSRIYMNHPLKHKGFTFYQASFEKNKEGDLVNSILSVNSDPGRWLKYYGSFLVILGSFLLFYFRKTFFKRKAP